MQMGTYVRVDDSLGCLIFYRHSAILSVMTGIRPKKNPYFGEILRSYRLERQLTQEQLSERVDVLRTYISALENGTRQPNLDMLLLLADALDITPGKLLDPIAEKMKKK